MRFGWVPRWITEPEGRCVHPGGRLGSNWLSSRDHRFLPVHPRQRTGGRSVQDMLPSHNRLCYKDFSCPTAGRDRSYACNKRCRGVLWRARLWLNCWIISYILVRPPPTTRLTPLRCQDMKKTPTAGRGFQAGGPRSRPAGGRRGSHLPLPTFTSPAALPSLQPYRSKLLIERRDRKEAR